MSDFSDFGLAAPILKAIAGEGYTTPTPIQTQAIPKVLAGHDLCGIAQTGAGKTAAFALPTLHRLFEANRRPNPRSCRALILSPTRELASQIADSFKVYGRHMRLSTGVAFGGVPIGKQIRMLSQGLDILVATPGRLLDLIDRNALTLSGVEILVLDEADRMMDLGFIHALRRIVTLVPKQRQNLFFSATMPKAIVSLADSFLTDPVKVAVTPAATTVDKIEQRVIFVPGSRKQSLLSAILNDPTVTRALIFTRTKHGADRVTRHLLAAGFEANAIHGNKSQGQRERALSDFKTGACLALVATDIAARGIDVADVSHVINFELPNESETYVHRIGRTGRAGASGIAISFCDPQERAYLRDIERLTRRNVPVSPPPEGFALNGPADVIIREAPQRREDAGRSQWKPYPTPGRSAERPQDQGAGRAAAARPKRRRKKMGERVGTGHANGGDAASAPTFLRQASRRGGAGRAE